MSVALVLLCALPLTLDAKHEPGKPMKDPAEAKIPWEWVERARKAADAEGETAKLDWTAGPVFEFGGAKWKLFWVREEYPMSNTETAWLVSGDQGVSLGTWVSSEAGASNDVISIAADGRIEVKTVLEPQLHDLGEGDTMVVKSSRSGKLLPKGKFSGFEPARYESSEGRYKDAKSGEVLTIVKSGVWYQGKAEKPPVLLQGKGLTLWFKAKPQEKYLLSVGDGFRTLMCKNPDGSVQTFVREW